MDTESTSRPPLSRRRFLASAAAGLLLSACGNPPTNSAQVSTAASPAGSAAGSSAGSAAPSAVAAASVAPTPTIAVSELGSGQQQITFWHGLGGPDGKTMTALLERFVAENPQYKIRQEAMQWNIFYQKFPTAVIANTPPDVVLTHEWAVPQFATRNMMHALDELYAAQGLARDDFVPKTMENITFDGKTLGVPLNVFGWGAYVNTKLLEAAGVDTAAPPVGGDAFVAMAKKLTTDTSGKHPGDEGFDPNSIDVYAIHMDAGRQTFLSTIWQFGGDIVSADGKTSRLNEPAVAQALQFWYDAIHTHHIAPVPVGYTADEAFANNKLAIWMAGSWQLNFIKDTPALQPPVTKIWPTPQWGTTAQTFTSSHIIGVPQQTTGAQLEAVTALITWLSNHSLEWPSSGMLPPRLSQQSAPEVRDSWHAGAFADMITAIGHPEGQHPNITEIQAAYLPEFIAIVNKQKPLETALNDAHTRVQRILDRQG